MLPVVKTLILVLGVSCVLAFAAAQSDPCSTNATLQSNCGSCLAASTSTVQCGYCISYLAADYCYPVGTNGWPANGRLCYGEDMEWHPTSCPDPCQSQGDCEQCRANFNTGCGFCMTTNQCLATSKKATCADWRDNINDANACIETLSCSQTMFCSSCVTNSNKCHWCGGVSGSCTSITQSCAGNTTAITDTGSCSVISTGSGARLASWLSFFFF